MTRRGAAYALVTLATFTIFDMAYDYITRMNSAYFASYQQVVYSRWTR